MSTFRHPIFGYEESIAWPPPHWRDVDCNYCCHPFDTAPVPVPWFYDRKEDTWYVFGIYCSWSCAKAHTFEQNGFNCGERVLLLETLARSRFKYSKPEPIVPAPPRSCLRKFAGPGAGSLTIEEFRAESTLGHCTSVISPPLISCPQVYERSAVPASSVPWSVKGIRASSAGDAGASGAAASASDACGVSAAPSMYGTYVRNKRAAPEDRDKSKTEQEGTLLDWRARSGEAAG